MVREVGNAEVAQGSEQREERTEVGDCAGAGSLGSVEEGELEDKVAEVWRSEDFFGKVTELCGVEDEGICEG